MIAPHTKRSSELKLVRDNDERWDFAYDGFMSLVAEDLREEIERIVSGINGNGQGLRCWINNIAYRGGVMPELIPREVLLVYLVDHEALPLHDCANCGLSVPVRPNRLYGSEGDPEEEYFLVCPACGGQTGLYSYWSNRDENRLVKKLKPR